MVNQIRIFVKISFFIYIIFFSKILSEVSKPIFSGYLDFSYIERQSDRSIINIPYRMGILNMEREIEGGKEFVKASLPLIIAGQKGLVEESDLLIPNMRGIMTARTKPLTVVGSNGIADKSKSISFEKPAAKQACKMVEAGQEKELVSLLHHEAKVI